MGDVIGITDSTGSLIATYTYGAWGEVLATTPATAGNSAQLAIANANPLRYRGYYLDQETGYYYLQSRYYNPAIVRFINSDDFVYLLIDALVAFSYCHSDPVNNADVWGQASQAYSRDGYYLKLSNGMKVEKYIKLCGKELLGFVSVLRIPRTQKSRNFMATFANRQTISFQPTR